MQTSIKTILSFDFQVEYGEVGSGGAEVGSRCCRVPVQCRKRWSNLARNCKKIKEWESQIRKEVKSFWDMRNDLRRERRLLGLFDRKIYDILDGRTTMAALVAQGILGLGLALLTTAAEEGKQITAAAAEEARPCLIAVGAPPERMGCFRILCSQPKRRLVVTAP